MNNDTTEPCVELTGMECLRLLSAFQALQMPEGFYGATHEQCADVIEQLTGKRPNGKPEDVSGSLQDFLAWHFSVPSVTAGPLTPVN